MAIRHHNYMSLVVGYPNFVFLPKNTTKICLLQNTLLIKIIYHALGEERMWMKILFWAHQFVEPIRQYLRLFYFSLFFLQLYRPLSTMGTLLDATPLCSSVATRLPRCQCAATPSTSGRTASLCARSLLALPRRLLVMPCSAVLLGTPHRRLGHRLLDTRLPPRCRRCLCHYRCYSRDAHYPRTKQDVPQQGAPRS